MLCVGLGKRLAWAKPIPGLQCCTELCDAVPEADYLNLNGLNVCSRKDVISNVSFLHDGAYRAAWKAVVSAKGSCGLQHKAEVLRLEEEPSKMVLSLKPTCCETAAELIRIFLPSSWPWQLIPAPPPELCNCFPVAMLCVVCSRSPGWLSMWQQGHEKLKYWRSLSWDSSYLRSMQSHCETAPIMLRLVLLLSTCSGWNLAPVKPTSNTHWWSRARISLSVASCATVEKKATFSFFFFFEVLDLWVIILNFQCLLCHLQVKVCFAPALYSAYPSFYVTLCCCTKDGYKSFI